MVAVVLALASAVSFGGSDYTAGLATRVTSVIRVVLTEQLGSILLALLIVPWLSPLRLSAAAAGWGAVAGVAGTAGATVLYLGFRYAAFSVASTLSAVGSAGLSVVAGLLFGERPGGLAVAGIVLALPAIAAVSAGGAPDAGAGAGGRGRHLAGVGYGLIAGVCFAVYFIGLNRAGSGSGLWPVLVGQAASLFVVVCAGAVRRELRMPADRKTRVQSVVTGVTGTAGTILFFVASHDGLLAVTAVITSLYPAVTIVLARVLLGERLSRMRLAGLCLAGASVALIAIAGAG
ncbi:MAG TPA: DMT family transporter [Streptosporangiaceae bacterium]|nr:DMT family transporter [Streptosporangiaceae bacterium]